MRLENSGTYLTQYPNSSPAFNPRHSRRKCPSIPENNLTRPKGISTANRSPGVPITKSLVPSPSTSPTQHVSPRGLPSRALRANSPLRSRCREAPSEGDPFELESGDRPLRHPGRDSTAAHPTNRTPNDRQGTRLNLFISLKSPNSAPPPLPGTDPPAPRSSRTSRRRRGRG